MTCPNCGSEEVQRRLVAGGGAAFFVCRNQARNTQKCAAVCACTCRECGMTFDFFLADPTRSHVAKSTL